MTPDVDEASGSEAILDDRLDVLVLEDDQIFRSLLVNALRNQAARREIQLRVDAVENLAAGLALLQGRQVDAMILDLNLPDSRGLATLETVLVEHPDVAVLVLTADEDEKLAARALELGAQDYLFKHFSEPLRMLQATLQAVQRKRRLMQEVERHRREERARRMLALGTMTSGIAHEHNNLQAVLMGNLELVLKRSEDGDIRARIERCLDVVRRSNEITRGLLDFAADTRGQFKSLDLRRVVQDAADQLEGQIRQYEVSLDLRLPRQAVNVLGNHSQLCQVVTNLGINACHAMAGRVVRELRIELRPYPAEAAIVVADSGKGIAERHRSRIFDPFFTTKEPGTGGERGITGTGLGLSVCDTFVRHHEGRIEVQSAVDHGTEIRVLLPLHELPTGGEPTTGEIRAVVLDDHEVVVVDPSNQLLEQVGVALRHEGCVVTTTASGRVALRLMGHRAPDVIVTRSSVGIGEDHGLIAAVLADQRLTAVPLVVITEADERWEAEQTTAPERIAAVLRTPFSDRQLLAAVARALRTRQTPTS